jgi:tetratricopeptide (TPR) repeat protein
MKLSCLLTCLLFSSAVMAQSTAKDSTAILKTGSYSNSKNQPTDFRVNKTIDVDSSILTGQDKTRQLRVIYPGYKVTTEKADRFFKKKQFNKAIEFYTEAFRNNNDMGQVKHRYNAACCYSMLGKSDSALYQLYRIAEKGKYYNYYEIENEAYFKNLHQNSRWEPLIAIIKKNAGKLTDEVNSEESNQNE